MYWLPVIYFFYSYIYGNKKGQWVDENTKTSPTSQRGKDRLKIENKWLKYFKNYNLPVQIFRLEGIYSIENNVMFRDKDVNFLEDSFGVDEAVGLYFQAAPIEIEEKRKYVFIAGSNIKENKKIIEEIYNLELFTGSDLDGSEKGDAVLGYNYLLDDDTFKFHIYLSS